MASKARFLDNVGVSAFGTNSGGDSSVSSSYALSASYADSATSASYAISASYEITKEVSSSYADTASFAQSGNGIFSGSFSGSFQGDGSNLTGVGAFPFSGSAVITGSLTITGSQTLNTQAVEKVDLGRYYIKTLNSYDTGFFGTLGGQLIISSSDFTYKSPFLVLDRGAGGPSGATDGLNLWVKKDLYVGGSSQLGDNIMTIFKVSGSATTGNGGQIDLGSTGLTTDINLNGHLTASAGVNISASATSTASFGTYLGDGSQLTGISTTPFPFSGSAVITGSLEISGSSDVTLDVKGDLNVSTNITASNNISSSNNIFSKQHYVEGKLALDYNNGIAIGNLSDSLNLLGTSITASSNLSSSAASTASFGTYLGDGSQLSNISTTPFPFSGSAVITGSLVVSGSFNAFTLDADNVVLGSGSGLVMQAGADSNVLIGTAVGTSLTTGDYNILIGSDVGGTLDTEANNIMIGKSTGRNSDGGDQNVYIGSEAGRYGSNAEYNVAIGYHTLRGGSGNTGDYNTALGYYAGRAIDNGAYNTFIGYFAGNDVTTGDNNILIGNNAGAIITTGEKNIFIGSGSLGETGTTNQLKIGHAGLITISASLATGDILLQGDVSSSATSTASFGTYLGDGSQLSGISSTPFPFTGDAQITGSLEISGSGNITSSGYMLITSSNTGGGNNSLMTPGLVINQVGSSQNHSGPAIRLVNSTNGEETNIYHQPGGSGASHGNALNILTDGGINIEAGDDIGSGGAFFRLAKGQALFTIDDDSSAPRTDVKIHNGNGGTAYSRLSLGAQNEYWYIEADDNNTPFNIGFDNGSTDTDVITFTKHDGSLTGSLEIVGGPLKVTGSLISSGSVVNFTGATAISGSTFSGSFVGNGSGLTNLPASDPFPFSGSAVITGSLIVSSSTSESLSVQGSGSTIFDVIGSQGTIFSVDDDLSGTIFTANDISGLPILEASASGDVYIGKSPQSLYTTAVISSTTAAVTQSIFGLSTSSYDGAFFDYTVQSGSNARAGSIMSVWNGSTINFTETTTTDIGDTTDFNLIVHISQSQAQIASHATNAGYKIKTIIRSI